MLLTRSQALKVYEWFSTHEAPTFSEFKAEFCSPSSEYKGYVLVRMSYDPHYGEEWHNDELMTVQTWKKVIEKDEFYLGELNGKHSAVYATYDEIVDQVLTEADDIADFIATHPHTVGSAVTDALDCPD